LIEEISQQTCNSMTQTKDSIQHQSTTTQRTDSSNPPHSKPSTLAKSSPSSLESSPDFKFPPSLLFPLTISAPFNYDLLLFVTPLTLLVKEIVRLHGLPNNIISNRDPRFTSSFWKSLFTELGTHLNFSTAYHLEPDGQTERVNRILEDMLQMYTMDKPESWEDYLYLVEFAYNQGYHSTIKMSPSEVVYG
jgi:hypothetical protein